MSSGNMKIFCCEPLNLVNCPAKFGEISTENAVVPTVRLQIGTYFGFAANEKSFPVFCQVITSTRRGQALMDACGRGKSSLMWTSTQTVEIRIDRRHPVFFLCK